MISRKKPKKEEFDEDDSEQQQAHHPPSAKKVKFSASLMNEDDEYSLWLVRKPIKVSLSDLSELKFPTITERRTEVLNGLKSECAELKCEFEPTQTQMLYVPMDTAKDSKDCKAGIDKFVCLFYR
ncbi:unnamed protein product [Anisakis simplex]|uniref:Uncharacterized protein n=1 Tax=Anisakis simplex TaxID=6269 RepID=A0A0M3JDB6_ANISI|nr:unnamed protein product [Anisakis simplex]